MSAAVARFADRVGIVTGAGHGIGRATAVLLAGEGARVVAVDTDAEALREVERAIHEAGGVCAGARADVLDEAEVEGVVADAVARFGGVDVLVNVVGGSTAIERPEARVEEISLDEWERVLAFNLRGTFLCSRAVVPRMKERGRGAIINLSSIVARGDPLSARTSAPYVLAKAGIEAFTRRLAQEVGPFGIRCNAVSPGVTLTERIARKVALRGAGEQAAMAAAVPLRRLGTPEDVARVIAFLASDDAAFVSGHTIDATGGQ